MSDNPGENQAEDLTLTKRIIPANVPEDTDDEEEDEELEEDLELEEEGEEPGPSRIAQMTNLLPPAFQELPVKYMVRFQK